MSKLGGDISRQRGISTGRKRDPWDRDKTAPKSSVGTAVPGGPSSTAFSPEEKYHLQPASTYAAANQGPLQQSSVPYAPGLQAQRQTETTGQSQKSDVGAAVPGGPPSSNASQEEEEYHPQPASTYAAANQGPLQQFSVPYAPGLQAERQTETTGQFQKSDVGGRRLRRPIPSIPLPTLRTTEYCAG